MKNDFRVDHSFWLLQILGQICVLLTADVQVRDTLYMSSFQTFCDSAQHHHCTPYSFTVLWLTPLFAWFHHSLCTFALSDNIILDSLYLQSFIFTVFTFPVQFLPHIIQGCSVYSWLFLIIGGYHVIANLHHDPTSFWTLQIHCTNRVSDTM